MSHKILTITICLLLTACSLPGAQTPSNPQAWFDMPLPDTVFIPPNQCQIIVHGASPNGIALFELSINGVVISSPEPGPQEAPGSLVMLNHDCGLLQPGRNLLELRVQDNSGAWSDSTQTTVFLAVRDVESTVPTVTMTSPSRATETAVPTFTSIPTLTPTLIPTSTPTIQPTGSVSIERVSTNLVYLGRADCGPLDVTITARATAPNGINVLVLFYRFQTGGDSQEFQSLSMNSIGGDLYQQTLNPTSLLGGSVPFDQATLQYQIVIQDNEGNTSLRTSVISDIVVQACSSTAIACSSYTDERTCIVKGCKWGTVAGTRQIACQNP